MSSSFDNDILAALPIALLALSADLEISYLNPAAEDLLGQGAAHLLGKNLAELPAFGADWCEQARRVINSGESVRLLEEKLELFHETIVVSVHIASIAAGGVLITIERQDGAQKLAAQAAKNEVMRASGMMVAMLAHEVKNPLSGIRGAAQLLQAEVAQEQQALAELICNETDRIRDLINRVEIFSAGNPELTAVNIHEVLQYAISIARAGFAAHASFRELYDPSLPMVFSNRDLLVQLFLNLIKNAAEATITAQNPTITISTYYQTGYRIGAISLPINVDIVDNGSGIPADMRAKIFEPFLSSKAEGRGLGLAIVAKLANLLNANIELDEQYKTGAKFVVRLAVAREEK